MGRQKDRRSLCYILETNDFFLIRTLNFIKTKAFSLTSMGIFYEENTPRVYVSGTYSSY